MINLLCKHCHEEIAESGDLSRYVHTDTDLVACDESEVTGPRAEPDLDRLVADAIAELAPTYHLAYAQYGDRLTPDQIQVLLNNENEYESKHFTELEMIESDQRWHAAREIIKDLLEPNLFDLLETYRADRLDEIQMEIQERDESGLITELLRETPNHLFWYALEVSVPDSTMDDWQRAATRQEIADAAGLDLADPTNVAKIDDMMTDAHYGGELGVIWYGNTQDAVNLSRRVVWNADGTLNTEPTGNVVWHGASLLILDRLNGSGGERPFPTITADWAPLRVAIDSPRMGGWSWTDIAGPSMHAYAADVTINRPTGKDTTDD